jgi:hypothetical protein
MRLIPSILIKPSVHLRFCNFPTMSFFWRTFVSVVCECSRPREYIRTVWSLLRGSFFSFARLNPLSRIYMKTELNFVQTSCVPPWRFWLLRKYLAVEDWENLKSVSRFLLLLVSTCFDTRVAGSGCILIASYICTQHVKDETKNRCA